MANKNSNLGAAKTAKNDEFYTQWEDIEREMNAYLEYDENVFRDRTVLLPCDDPEWSNFTKYFAQNFERFGLKKLISTSYAVESKKYKNWEPTLFETEAPQYDADRSKTNGKIFILDRDTNGSGRIDIEDLRWEYLEGDGDFRSDEVKRLRDEADIIVTNPPFSLFREFLAWIMEAGKKFSIIGNVNMQQYFSGLDKSKQELILNTPLTIYVCKGEEPEIKEWFRTINIAGVPLVDQELLNAIYSGPFVTKAKAEFSNSQNALVQKWSAYLSGDVKRQAYLSTALKWVRRGNIEAYMSAHRYDGDINELRTYFSTVIDWADSVFPEVWSEMCGLDWGRLYEEYHNTPYNPKEVLSKVEKLMEDDYVSDRKGIFEYLLGGEKNKSLLNIRVLNEPTKKKVYVRQTKLAEAQHTSNCPYCTMSDGANKARIYKLNEMDADHVTAWSKGGSTDESNCQMLCKTHNRAKGNR